MRHGSLFSGIGGFDLAAEWMGWENVFHCEWMEFPRKVLKYYWPKAISYENICTTDFSVHRGEIDILTGGFPCQPYSAAGKRLGKEDSRHLWPEMLRAIREIEPSWVVGENVRGLTNWNGGVVFEEVCTGLESCGYEVQPILLPAASVGAPHRRDRIWFVAYCDNARNSALRSRIDGNWKKESSEWQQPFNEFDGQSNKRNASNSNSTSIKGEYISQKRKRKFNGSDCRNGINKWQNFPTQSPICHGDDGLSYRLDSISFPKWRNESIKGGGNAIVPQVALQLFRVIEQLKQRQ